MVRIPVKTAREIALMRESGRIVAEVLTLIEERIRPGARLIDLDAFAEELIRSRGGEPAFKGYGHDAKNLFPGTLCVSVDDQVVHGIPDTRVLKEGQIVSIDVGVRKGGYFGDAARTYAVGKVSEEKRRLLRVTEEALRAGLAQACPGNRLHDISAAVQERVEKAGFSVVRDLVGHGIGKNLHEEPPIPNYGSAGTGPLLQEGMTLAVEPMVNAGTYRVQVESDGWTVTTVDGKPSAHFEHTVVVRQGEPEILTRHG
jgi:methionyl aminopeptidase